MHIEPLEGGATMRSRKWFVSSVLGLALAAAGSVPYEDELAATGEDRAAKDIRDIEEPTFPAEHKPVLGPEDTLFVDELTQIKWPGDFELRRDALRAQLGWRLEDRVLWSRQVAVSLLGDLDDRDRAFVSLLEKDMRLIDDLGSFYGPLFRFRFGLLLLQHEVLSVAWMGRLQEGKDDPELLAKLYDNAEALGRVLGSANPVWGQDMTVALIELTQAEENVARARADRDWIADSVAQDDLSRQGRRVSILLAAGIIHQFPNRYGSDVIR
jgi:hypothetical protein